MRRGATPEEMAKPIHVRPDCSQENCSRRHFAKGYCKPHYERFTKGATEEEMAPPIASRNTSGVLICGHEGRRYGGNGLCHSCYVAAWIKAHPDANSGNNWLRNNPERARYLQRRANLKKRGTTPEEYDAMWARQEGRCANPGCRSWYPLDPPDYRKALHADHCHKSGKIRALLCPGCNIALGHVDDNPGKLAGLIEYLQRFKE
jgi:hypothetical protein